MAEFAFNKLGVQTAAAIHDGDAYTQSLAQLFADSFEALGGPNLAFSGEPFEKFMAAYQGKYGPPISVFHAFAFDAANMIFAWFEQLGVEHNGALQIGRPALRDCLYATKDFHGITGSLTCTQYGDCADPRISVSQLRDGEYLPVWP